MSFHAFTITENEIFVGERWTDDDKCNYLFDIIDRNDVPCAEAIMRDQSSVDVDLNNECTKDGFPPLHKATSKVRFHFRGI